jgi:[methyl-Co(III) methanol-specific corrinoid protein]:coenzyme M methyltransferase
MQLTERQRLMDILEGRTVDRPAVICPGGMMSAATIEVLQSFVHGSHTDPFVMADTAVEIRKSTGFENFGVPFCMTVEAEPLGSIVDLGNSSVEPRVVAYAGSTLAELKFSSAPDPASDGRLPVVLEAISILARLAGPTPVIGNLTGPVSLASSVLDPMQFFRLMGRDPGGVHVLLDFLTDYLAAFARAQVRAGADVVCIADPTASGEIIGADFFREFAAPCLTRLIDEVRANGAGAILHICGDTSILMDEMSKLRGAALSFDSVVNMKKAKEKITSSPLMGNISTQLLDQGTPEKVRNAAMRALQNGVDIVSPACGLSLATPLENLKALTDTVKNAGSKPR